MTGSETGEYGWDKGQPMPLHDKIRQDLKTAMRSKDDTVRNTIRQIMAEFPNLTVPITLESGKKTTRLKKPEEITDDDVIDIIRKLVKSETTVQSKPLSFKKVAVEPVAKRLRLSF